MANRGNAPKLVTWVICLILYIIAMVAHFGLVQVDAQLAQWSWIVGFGLLLVAARIRGL
jgi:hypothetical protein